MQTLEERSLAERLKPRMVREEQFARTGRKLRNKSWLFRHEKKLIRPFLKAGLYAVGLYGRGVRNALQPVVRRFQVWSPRLPSAFDGYTLLQISDLHFDEMPRLADAIGAVIGDLTPDLCVITGDYRFDDEGPCDGIYPQVQKLLKYLRPPDGIFSILGNHDISEIAFTLSKMGVRMLVNEAVELRRGHQSIWLAGLDDPFDYKCDDLPGTLADIPADAFKLLLVHTPELYQSASDREVDLYLCGHTHAGQIRFPIVGSIRNNANCPKAYAYGRWTHGAMQAYTSAGAGCSSLPIRYNCPPEVTLIELRSGSEPIA